MFLKNRSEHADSPRCAGAVVREINCRQDRSSTLRKGGKHVFGGALPKSRWVLLFVIFFVLLLILLCCTNIYAMTSALLDLEGGLLSGFGRDSPVSDLRFAGIDESVMPPIVIRSTDQVCAMCTDGLVYVHLGRHALSTEQPSAAPVNYTVLEELYVRLKKSPVFTATSGSADEVVSRCLAQLASLGQMGMAVNGKPQLTASVIVDFDSATPQTSLGVGGQCPAFLAEVRPSTNTSGTVKMEVSYPRLPSWPLPYALNPALHGGTDAHGTLPPYFGTVAVRETDVDKDVRPPLSVALTEDRGAVVIRFGEDETSTRPEPFEMRCPAHFMSVFIGRYGRQHNQVQEMMHTLALTHRLNRTYIVPILMPESYVPPIRYDAQKAYGFNALRREGGYCLVTYEEARRVFKVMEAQGEPLTLQRFNYYANRRPATPKEWRNVNSGDWWLLPTAAMKGKPASFNIDGWFEDTMVRSPPVTTVFDRRADGMHFREARGDFTVQDVYPNRDEEKYVRMARMRKAAKMMVELLGGDHAKMPDGAPQPRLAVMSARMAFYLRPPMVEQTRLMGLLRPAAAITAEVDRWYSRTAAALRWPTAGSVTAVEEGTRLELRDTLRTGNFKKVMGFHIRRREGTCRDEGVNVEMTAYAIDIRFRLEQTDPGWSSPVSTLTHLELDCALTKGRIVELYKQYARWMRRNMTIAGDGPPAGGVSAGDGAGTLVPTMYMAYDDQSGPIKQRVEQLLKEMQSSPQKADVWGNTTAPTEFPKAFVAAYDKRISGDFYSLFIRQRKKVEKESEGKKSTPALAEQERVKMVDGLYEPGLTEVLAMATDYFMLTNMATFRGVTVSSVTTNVMMRRWGRGLPCNSALFGYVQSFYAGMWS